jgi:hypothetical protein
MFYIDITILINAGTLAPRVANWLPKFDGISFSFYFALRTNTRPKVVQHLLVTWGRLKIFI